MCRTGAHGTDGAAITEQDLKEIVETFAPPRPVSLGHDMAKKDNFPKFGDVLMLEGIFNDPKNSGEKVLVGHVALHPELDRQYESGLFGGWSVTIPKRAVDGKRYLHSLAVTGATPPKISGLQELMAFCGYCDGDNVEVFEFGGGIEFMEAQPMTEEEKKKMATLEAENAKLKKAAEEAARSKFSQGAVPEAKPAGEQNDARYADMQSELERLKAGERKARLDAFSEKIKHVPAGIKTKALAVAGTFESGDECEFGDDGKTKKVDTLDLFAQIVSEGFKGDSLLKPVTQGVDFSDSVGGDGKPLDWGAVAARL